jgi:hypothetical protein
LRTSATSCFSLRKRNLNAMASAGFAGWVDCWCCEPRSSRQLKQMCGDLASQRRPRGNFDRLAYFMPNAFRTEQALKARQFSRTFLRIAADSGIFPKRMLRQNVTTEAFGEMQEG